MKKLKIALISLKISPDSQDGGAKFFTGIYNYLKKQGHNITLITGKWGDNLNDPQIIQINLIKKRFLWVPQFNLKVAQILKNSKFDIIHGNGPKGTFPIILSRKKKFISTIHDLGPFETKFTRIPIEKFIIKYIAQKASYITTCSDIVKSQISYYIPSINLNNISNVYSAIEDKFKPYPKEATELKQKLGIEGPIIIYIGRIASYKGVNDIISAYKIAKRQISDLNLIIGGIPDFSMQKTYQEWKHSYKDVKFEGFISEKDIPIYYSLGDVFVTYSYASEGFGLTPIEAIACGTPVIASSILVYKEILQDNAVFVSPRKPEQLAKEIISLLKDKEKSDNLLKKAQQFIKRYSWETVGSKIEDIYEKFLRSY